MLGNLVGGFVTILIGVNLLPVVAYGVNSAIYNNTTGLTRTTNVTGAAATLTGLVTIFYALGVMAIGLVVAIGGLKQAGVM